MAAFDFEKLYRLYPRKEGKKAGMKKLEKIVTTNNQYASFASAVENYAKLCADEARQLKFIKMFSTFVNNWEDYEAPVAPSTPRTVLRSQVDRILKGEL